MISDDELDRVCLQWQAMAIDERQAVMAEVLRLRPLVEKLPSFVNETAEIYRKHHSPELFEDFASCSEVPRLSGDGDSDVWAVELAVLQVLLDPKTRAWDNLIKHLLTVRSATDISAAPEAVLFAENMVEVFMESVTIRGSLIASAVFDFFLPRPEKLAQAERSRMAAENAMKRNIDSRAWVICEWAGRTRRDESKAAFARRYVAKVKEKFDTTVSAEQIARKWLPKQGG